MAKRIATANYLSAQELLVHYRQATNVTERTHYQIIWLLVRGKTPLEVAKVTGDSRTWMYQLVKRYNKWGTKGLGDGRRHNQGQEAILTDLQQAQLWQVLYEKSPDGRLWNGRKVADWLSELTGKQVSRHRGWEYLKQMTFRLRVPRPEHGESDLLEQENWKKNWI